MNLFVLGFVSASVDMCIVACVYQTLLRLYSDLPHLQSVVPLLFKKLVKNLCFLFRLKLEF
jgi:hypothetical protein